MSRPAKIKEPKLSKREMYLGNPNLPSSEAKFEYTPEMVDEMEKCKNSITYFAQNYFYIIEPDLGKMLIPLLPYQLRLLKAFEENRFNIVLSSRQSGKCFSKNTYIKVKTKQTGEIEDVNALDFYLRLNHSSYTILQHQSKLIETYDIEDYEIWTDTGWHDLTHFHKTVEYDVWVVKTENFELECADDHILFKNNDYEEIFCKNLKLGDLIWTENGLEKIQSIIKTDRVEHMYDATVDSTDHRIYTNGILSHNTTCLTILALWFTCFHDYKNTVIVANKEDTAKMIFKRVKLAYQELPTWLKPAVVTWGQESSEFANGSLIGISTTTGSAARGQAIQLLLLDELAFIEPESIVEDFMKSVIPTISRAKTSRILITSTPKGKNNVFFKYYDAATKVGTDDWNGFHAEEVMWTEIPGRDEEWKRKEIAKLGSYESFKVEYECYFTDDGTSAIDVELFDELKKQCFDPKHLLDEGHYKIWEDPDPSRLYVAGVDVSEGVGGDASVIQMLDITDLKDIKQVAEYHNNQIAPAEFSNKLYDILLNWGSPLALIERNNQGGQVCDRLAMDFAYEKVVSWGAKKAHKTQQFGVLSHTNTKHAAILNQRYFINEMRNVTFRSINTLNEFKTFVRYPNGTWKAKGGEHDDRVMAFVWALMILFNEITEIYFELDELDDYGKPLKISPYDFGVKYFENPTSIYTNEQVNKIENSNLSPMAFGAFGEGDDEMAGLMADGWQYLNGQSPFVDPSRTMSQDSHDAMNRWFH